MGPMVKNHLMIRAHPTRDLALRGRTIKVVCLVSLAMAKIIPKKTPKTTIPLPMNLQMGQKNNAILWLGSPSWMPPSLTLQ